MEQYHGTNRQTAIELYDGKVSVEKGGGELGIGFYTGDLPHEAFNWAHHRYGERNKSVVKFIFNDDEFLNLAPLCLEYFQTVRKRQEIRDAGETRVYRFFENAIWAPVVGKVIPNFNQIKFESEVSKDYLNSTNVTKNIIS